MLAIALSLLFGLVAFAAVIEIGASSLRGWQRGRAIHAELAQGRRRTGFSQAAVHPQWQPASLRAAA